ncbi:ComF family protein [Candidatus Woesebacteria bacterium]|nr:ComF family protein [Candidatus Woesebacteria bacterium]
MEKSQRAAEICPECKIHSFRGKTHKLCKKPHGLDGAFSVWQYKRVIRKAILGLKYRFVPEIAKELAKAFVSEIKKRPLQLNKPILVPVPLHPRRKRWRGFNQSEEIGKILAQNMKWEFRSDLLIRKKSTQPQTELKRSQRKHNVKGVFVLNPKYQSLITSHRALVIFDDVWTTGSTIKEAARVLKRKGAKSVWGLTISRSK